MFTVIKHSGFPFFWQLFAIQRPDHQTHPAVSDSCGGVTALRLQCDPRNPPAGPLRGSLELPSGTTASRLHELPAAWQKLVLTASGRASRYRRPFWPPVQPEARATNAELPVKPAAGPERAAVKPNRATNWELTSGQAARRWSDRCY